VIPSRMVESTSARIPILHPLTTLLYLREGGAAEIWEESVQDLGDDRMLHQCLCAPVIYTWHGRAIVLEDLEPQFHGQRFCRFGSGIRPADAGIWIFLFQFLMFPLPRCGSHLWM
jgi:hypothetical protein